ncbi:MAG TPA: hypothetical protein VI010_10020, partial [Xanthobacteraceae bacterium]
MHNPRYNRVILASTALALIMAIPLVGRAKNDSQIATAPMAATPAEQAAPQAAPATVTPASEPAAISNGTASEPAAA